jgi:hypothetical protein
MGSFRQRLGRLEKVTPRAGTHCTRCGGPAPGGRRIAYESSNRPVRRCEACLNPIDAQGRPLGEWRNGGLHLKVIVFADEGAAGE